MADEIITIPNLDVQQTYASVVRRYEDNLSKEQLLALPYLVYGVSTEKISEILKIKQSTVAGWLRNHEDFRAALGEMTSAIGEYHYTMLNQLAVKAWDVLARSLSDDSGVSQLEQLRSARFIIDQLGLKTNRVEVNHIMDEAPEVNVSEGSIDVIARKLHELSLSKERPNLDAVDAEYKTIELAPIIACHPETTFGVLNTNEDGRLQCHVCGSWLVDLAAHVERMHDITPEQYKAQYMIDARLELKGIDAEATT